MKAFVRYLEKVCGSSLETRNSMTQPGVKLIMFESNVINHLAFAVRVLIKHKVYTAWASPVASGYKIYYTVMDPEIGLSSTEAKTISISSQLTLL